MRTLLRSLTPERQAAALASLPPEAAAPLLFDWTGLRARPAQLPPSGSWSTWLVCAGRGFGKTRCGAEWVRDRVTSGVARRIALVGATAADVRDVMIEGPAGILAVSPPWSRPVYEPSKRRLTWPNGAVATTFSADKPDRLRGPQQDTAWCDELAAWRYPRLAWDNLQLGLRLGSSPQACVTTTPRPIPLVRELLKDPTTAITRGSTYENARNLAGAFLRKILAKYEGTRLGRQELKAELLEDTPGALWTLLLLETHRVEVAPDCKRIVVAIDPAAASHEGAAETGIVVAGLGANDHGYVLEDASGHYTPGEWGAKAVKLFDDYEADMILGEVNNGGEMVGHTVQTVRKGVPFRAVHASRGKRTRAEPIAALDEQGKVHHVGVLPQLEDQMTTWDASSGAPSPDRMDARVWALTDLMLDLVDRGEDPNASEASDESRWSGHGGRGF